MKTEINRLPKSEIELKIEVPVKEWQEFLDEAAKELSKDLKIEGFRENQVPRPLVEEKIGFGKILETAAENCVRKCYVRAILQEHIEAVGQPEISVTKIAKGNPFEFKARVGVMPEVKLPDYKKIASEVKKRQIQVEEKEIEDVLSWLQKSRAKFTLKQNPCQKGDWVEIEYSSAQIENGKQFKDNFTLGEGHFISGFEENLIGMENNQEKQFFLTFPKEYFKKDLAGREVGFKVKLKLVQKVELPEINDQFAQSSGGFENLAVLRKNIRGGIIMEKEKEESQRVRQKILENIAEKAKLEIPEILIAKEQNQMMEILKQNVSQTLGISFEDYLVKTKSSEKELLESFLPQAKEKIKNFLVLKEVSKKENIEVSEEEIKNEINKILKNYPIEKVKELDPNRLKGYTENVVREEKTFQYLESLIKKP